MVDRIDVMKRAFTDEMNARLTKEKMFNDVLKECLSKSSPELIVKSLMGEWQKEYGNRLAKLEELFTKSIELAGRPQERPIVHIDTPKSDNIIHVLPTPYEIKNDVAPTPIEVKNLVSTPGVDNYVQVNPTPVEVKNFVEQAVVNVDVNPTPIEVKNFIDTPYVVNNIPPTNVNVETSPIVIDMKPVANAITLMEQRLSVMEKLLQTMVNRPKKTVIITHEDGSKSEVNEI